jgi:putative transposase
MLLARRVRLRPSRGQRIALARAAGSARWAWNYGLRKKIDSYAATGKSPSAVDLHRELNALKQIPVEDGGVPWMYESSKCAPQEALRDLDEAYNAFFLRCQRGASKKGFPKFKAKRPGEGRFRLTGAIVVTDTHLRLPRIGAVRIAPDDREYAPKARYSVVSVVQEHGEWFASVRVEVEERPPVEAEALADVGIDLGVRKLAVLATPDGATEVIPNRRALLRAKRKLRAAQKVVARREKGSARRRRAVRKVGRVHRRVAHVRKDMTHKATTSIARRFRVVAIEALKPKNMTKAAHGIGRAAKAGLNRVLLDANLAEFRRQLAYKLPLNGGRLVLVDPAFTSRRCSACGSFNDPGSSEVYTCAACGAVIDRDENAAKNILALARGEIDAASWTESKNARGADLESLTSAFTCVIGIQ